MLTSPPPFAIIHDCPRMQDVLRTGGARSGNAEEEEDIFAISVRFMVRPSEHVKFRKEWRKARGGGRRECLADALWARAIVTSH